MKFAKTLPIVPNDDAWRYAIVVGLASIPFTLVLYWQSSNTMSLWPAFVAGAIVGYLFDAERATVDRAGVRTGFVAALAIVWPLIEMLAFIVGLVQPVWFGLVQAAAVIGFVAIAACLSALVALIGAKIGNWLATKTGGNRPSAASV